MTQRALIVIDVQREYFAESVDGSTGKLPIAYPPVADSLANIGTAIDTASAFGVPVVVVRHTAPEDAPLFNPTTPQWRLHPAVGDRPRDHLVEKRTSSAFVGTDLGDWLAEHDIDTLTVTGYMTQNCVFATAFDAHARGLAVEVLSDATGTLPIATDTGSLTARQHHETVLTVLSSNIATVTGTADWLDAAKSATPLPHPNIVAATEVARRE